MFESLTHWLDSLEKESKLFNNQEEEVLHSALASVLYHIIIADKKIARQEPDKFASILKHEFDLNEQQVGHLYQAAKSSASDLSADLNTVNDYLKQKPGLRMSFMDKLNQLVYIDGVHDGELDIFFEALHLVFPDIKRNVEGMA